MHDSAYRIGELVMRAYCDLPNAKILEIGSLNVNGCLRDAATPTTHYVGLDLEEGPSVDFVIAPGEELPIADDSFDLVMASSVFEHDSRFWDTFVRMCRAARAGGHIYVNAPSNGTVHRYPMDCWRFYPDAGLALAEHARSAGLEIDLVESFIGNRHSDVWNDFVAVFRKGPSAEPLNTAFVYSRYPSLNARTWQSRAVYNESADTEDMALIRALRQRGENAPELDDLRAGLAEAEAQRSTLAAEIDRLSIALAESERHEAQRIADSEHLMGQVATLGGDLRRRQEEIERLSATLAESEQHEAQRVADSEYLKDQVATLEADLRRRQEEIDRISAALAESEQHDAQMIAVSDYLKGELATRDSNLRQRQEEIEQAWARATELTAESDSLRDRIVELEASQERHATKLVEANGWVFELAAERSALEGRLATVQGELHLARRSLGQMEDLIDHKRRTAQAMRHMAEQKAALQKDIEALVERLDQASADQLQAQEQIATLNGTIASLRSDALDMVEQKVALHQEIEALVERLEHESPGELRAKEQIAMLNGTIASLRSDALSYHGKAAQAIEQLAALQAEHKQQTQALRRFEEHSAKKDRDLAWMRRLFQLLEKGESRWNVLLPARLRRQNTNEMLHRAGFFDADSYLTKYPDVAEAEMDPLRHYILHGMAEGRQVNDPA